VLDARKTTPTLRVLEKYAVRAGGSTNHRAGLYDAVLIKDNHIRLAGGVSAAVERTRRYRPDLPIEVEAQSLAQVAEALAAGADTILLDNLSLKRFARPWPSRTVECSRRFPAASPSIASRRSRPPGPVSSPSAR
jgi:nicotinate-nucleotide pyrophosphorylase (carboxylating)